MKVELLKKALWFSLRGTAWFRGTGVDSFVEYVR